jgi:hypothetical protein
MELRTVRPPRSRIWLIKSVLTVSVLALIATSDSDWQIGDADEQQAAFFRPGGSAVQRAEGTVLYRTPRGHWPLSMSGSVRSAEIGTPYKVSASFETDERLQPSKTNKWSGEYDVVCEEKTCEGSVSVELRLERANDNLPAEDASMTLADGGRVPLAPALVTLRAGFSGGPDGPVLGCAGKGSSTDSIDPPKQLGVEVTLLPFEFDTDAGTVPGASDAGPSDAAASASRGVAGESATEPLSGGLDAGL